MQRKNKLECLVNGYRRKYDACSDGKLEEAKEFYKYKFEYIGSGHTYYVNNEQYYSDQIRHFFVYKFKRSKI